MGETEIIPTACLRIKLFFSIANLMAHRQLFFIYLSPVYLTTILIADDI